MKYISITINVKMKKKIFHGNERIFVKTENTKHDVESYQLVNSSYCINKLIRKVFYDMRWCGVVWCGVVWCVGQSNENQYCSKYEYNYEYEYEYMCFSICVKREVEGHVVVVLLYGMMYHDIRSIKY